MTATGITGNRRNARNPATHRLSESGEELPASPAPLSALLSALSS